MKEVNAGKCDTGENGTSRVIVFLSQKEQNKR
jgi:hypothetical protein